MANISPSFSKQETKYLNILKQHPGSAYLAKENAPIEGFEYFASDAYRKKIGKSGSLFTDKFGTIPLKNIPRLLWIMLKNFKGIFSAQRRSFTDIVNYLDDLETTDHIKDNVGRFIKSYPNSEMWQSLVDYAMEKWCVKIGFTEVPAELIFKNKAIMFKYALVVIQEMDKEHINSAPDLDAGEEVLGVYNSLGLAVNDIARWLRKQYGICCQSNHPLGGLVNTVPLAVKAGMGWVGSNGLVITPDYGQRQRIAPIFIEDPIFKFTDSTNHKWIEEYCSICGRCEKACPTGAILKQKFFHFEKIADLGPSRTCIDRDKCYPYFNETLGCSICVKVCPFSRGKGTYEHLKKVMDNRKSLRK